MLCVLRLLGLTYEFGIEAHFAIDGHLFVTLMAFGWISHVRIFTFDTLHFGAVVIGIFTCSVTLGVVFTITFISVYRIARVTMSVTVTPM